MLRSLLLAVPLALSACASSAPVVQARAHGPLAAAAFQISATPSPEAKLSATERSVSEALQARGWREAGQTEEPAYLVEVAFSRRPRGVAAAVPQDQGGEILLPAAGRTLRRPLVTGAETLTIRIVERRSGRELYSASATVAGRTTIPADSLVRSALQPLAGAR